MRKYYRDKVIKFAHSPVIETEVITENVVGPSADTSLRTLDFTPADDSCIFVSSLTGDDETGTGTQTSPVASIKKALTLIDASHSKVVIIDSETYDEPGMELNDSNLAGIYAANGCIPTVAPEVLFNLRATTSLYTSEAIPSVYTDDAMQAVRELSDGNVIRLWLHKEGSTTWSVRFKIYSPDLSTTIQEETTIISTAVSRALIAIKEGYFRIATCTGSTTITHHVYKFGNDGVEIGESFERSASTLHYPMGLTCLENDDVIVVYGDADNADIKMDRYSSGGTYLNTVILESATRHGHIDDIIPLSDGRFLLTYCKYDDGFDVEWEAFVCICAANGSISHKEVMGWGESLYMHFEEDEENEEDEEDTGVLTVTQVVDNSSNSTVLHVYEFTVGVSTLTDKTLKLTHNFNHGGDISGVINNMQYCKSPYDGYNIILMSLIDNMVSATTELRIYDSSWSLKRSEIVDSGGTSRLVGKSFIHANMALYYSLTDFYTGGTSAIYANEICDSYCIKTTIPIELNGLTIDGGNQEYLQKMIWSQANLILKYCDIYSREPRDTVTEAGFTQYDLHLTGIPTIQNTIIRDGWNTFIDADQANISWSQFYRLQGAVTIDGAAATAGDITIDHIDYFNNYEGFIFLNNSGNEIVKNSIFHYVSAEAVEADTDITLSNSILTTDTTNVTLVDCIEANPLYLNEGALDPDQVDLNLKIREMGYLATSPGYLLGDDNENAGSYNVSYDFEETSRTFITLPKENLDINYRPVNAVTQDRADGSARFYKDAIQESIQIPWDSLLEDDFNKVLAMIASESDSILVYPEPASDPTHYFEATLTWSKLQGSPKHYRQSETGVNRSNSITLLRKYEPEIEE